MTDTLFEQWHNNKDYKALSGEEQLDNALDMLAKHYDINNMPEEEFEQLVKPYADVIDKRLKKATDKKTTDSLLTDILKDTAWTTFNYWLMPTALNKLKLIHRDNKRKLGSRELAMPDRVDQESANRNHHDHELAAVTRFDDYTPDGIREHGNVLHSIDTFNSIGDNDFNRLQWNTIANNLKRNYIERSASTNDELVDHLAMAADVGVQYKNTLRENEELRDVTRQLALSPNLDIYANTDVQPITEQSLDKLAKRLVKHPVDLVSKLVSKHPTAPDDENIVNLDLAMESIDDLTQEQAQNVLNNARNLYIKASGKESEYLKQSLKTFASGLANTIVQLYSSNPLVHVGTNLLTTVVSDLLTNNKANDTSVWQRLFKYANASGILPFIAFHRLLPMVVNSIPIEYIADYWSKLDKAMSVTGIKWLSDKLRKLSQKLIGTNREYNAAFVGREVNDDWHLPVDYNTIAAGLIEANVAKNVVKWLWNNMHTTLPDWPDIDASPQELNEYRTKRQQKKQKKQTRQQQPTQQQTVTLLDFINNYQSPQPTQQSATLLDFILFNPNTSATLLDLIQKI